MDGDFCGVLDSVFTSAETPVISITQAAQTWNFKLNKLEDNPGADGFLPIGKYTAPWMAGFFVVRLTGLPEAANLMVYMHHVPLSKPAIGPYKLGNAVESETGLTWNFALLGRVQSGFFGPRF